VCLFFALLSLCAIAATPAPGQSSPAFIAQQCFRLGDTPRGYCSAPESIDCPGYRTWLETCQQALAAYPNDPRVKLAADARALVQRAAKLGNDAAPRRLERCRPK